MAWIESHQSLSKHRKTLATAGRLSVDRHKLIGHLHELWWWALDNVGVDGEITGLTSHEIAQAADWDGDPDTFLEALIHSGFIDRVASNEGEKLLLHDWYDYAGKLIEKRLQERERSRQRRRVAQETTSGQPAVNQRSTVGTVPYRTVPNSTLATTNKDDLPSMTEEERSILHELHQVQNYPRDILTDLDFIRNLSVEYPTVNILEEAKKWRTSKLDKPLKTKSNPRLQLRNWCANAAKWQSERSERSGRSGKPAGSTVKTGKYDDLVIR